MFMYKIILLTKRNHDLFCMYCVVCVHCMCCVICVHIDLSYT